MNWLQKLLYKWSGYDDRIESWARELALRDMLHTGIEIGKKQAHFTVVEKRVCRLHPIVLLNEIGPGHYVCMLCLEERHTGPIPGTLMMQERDRMKRETPWLIPDTQKTNAIRLKNKGEMK
jgi:hypothetical protein